MNDAPRYNHRGAHTISDEIVMLSTAGLFHARRHDLFIKRHGIANIFRGICFPTTIETYHGWTGGHFGYDLSQAFTLQHTQVSLVMFSGLTMSRLSHVSLLYNRIGAEIVRFPTDRPLQNLQNGQTKGIIHSPFIFFKLLPLLTINSLYYKGIRHTAAKSVDWNTSGVILWRGSELLIRRSAYTGYTALV